MRTIEIDDDLYRFLQRHSTLPADTPNSILKRLLDIKSSRPAISDCPKPDVVDTAAIGSNEYRMVLGQADAFAWEA